MYILKYRKVIQIRKKNKLKIIIIDRELTIKQLANDLGMSPQTISNWCNNKNLDNIYAFYRLCKHLDVDIRDIFTD